MNDPTGVASAPDFHPDAKPQSSAQTPPTDADQDQRAYLAGIRHELRTPINHIIGYSEMLQEEVTHSNQSDFFSDLEKIRLGGHQLLGLISDYFDPDKFSARNWEARIVVFQLRTPVSQIIGYTELLQDLAADKGQTGLITDLQKIQTAATQWLRLMEGYLLSSEKLPTRRSSPLESPRESTADSGTHGFVRQTLAKGTGVGALQEGSLLVVDDDDANRDMLARRLLRQGYEVTVAKNGEEALALASRRKFDLVLLDLIMPGLDGRQVLEQFKTNESLRHIPVLMISALDDMEGIIGCISMGAEDYIAKPFNAVFLRARIGAALEKKRLRDREQIYLRQLEEAQEKAERLLLNILPHSIAERLKEGEHGIADSFPEVTVLFADLVGFTTFSANSLPSEVVTVLNEVFSAFDRLAGRHGLEKIKTIGDAYMAVCGLPLPRSDHADAAAGMALDMQEEIQRFNQRHQTSLQMRIGLNTGPVIAGIIGTKKFIYDLWGDTVNTASRMESQGKPGSIQVTQATFERLQNRFALEPRGSVEIKGRGTMNAYWLVGRSTLPGIA